MYSRPKQVERSRDFDVEHYRIELSIDDVTRSFLGKTTIILTSLRDGLEVCLLDAETFTVREVSDGRQRALEYEHADGVLTVHLAEPLQYGEGSHLVVTYSAENIDDDPRRSGPGMNFHSHPDHFGYVVATSSWPESARHWFPSQDHPNDRATQEILATVREDYKVLSNGELVSVSAGPLPGTQTWHWSQDLPHCTYLFTLVAGPYTVIEDSWDDIPINYWVLPEDVEKAERSFHKTPSMIEFFAKEFGYDYPWAKYDQITVPGFGGGMENTTATVLGRGTLHDDRAEQDFPSHGLVAHEAAHMWWGDLVSYRAWQETWISESFATYGEYLYSKHSLGEDEGAINLKNKKDSYLREAHSRYIRPIVFDRWDEPDDNFDRHTYQKGAVVLNMLRQILGDTPFRRAMAHFLREHEFEAVDTHDFQVAIKEATGQNVDWFFEQWIFSPGHPVFDLSYRWNETSQKLRLEINQIQDTSQHVPAFRVPVTIAVHTSSSITRTMVLLKETEEVVELDVDEKPLLVRFDEGNYLLKEWTFEKSVDELIYQLENDDVIGRMWAAEQLAQLRKDDRVVKALVEIARNHGFWSVRASAVTAVSSFYSNDLVSFFQEMAVDPSSEVRVAAIEALGQSTSSEVVTFLQERFRSDDSYRAQAEILRSLGMTGNPKMTEFLKSAVEVESHRDVVARAGREALEQIEGETSKHD
jgi:aminopeptidase N